MIQRCRKCVMPTTRPDTAFVDGVCSACLAYEKRPQIDWEARKRDLLSLLERFHGKCIVPSSGGKDSTYQALTLKELGVDVVAVTASTCHLTPIGRQNIENLKRHVTTIEMSPNATVRAKLNRLGLTMVGDISWPEHVSIFTTPFWAALMTQRSLIFYGENPQNQYGGPLGTEAALTMTTRWVQEFGGFLGLRASDLVGVEGLTEQDMAFYMPPDPSRLQASGVEAHFLGQYLPWDSHRNAEVAIAAGMRAELPTVANLWPAENLDNAQTGLHDHGMYRKFGYGRGCAQASVDVRTGRITREDALRFVETFDGLLTEEYAGVKVGEVLKRIGMTRKELKQALDAFTNWELFDGWEAGRPALKAA
jgi:N-acetyl sugar amidotransferase